MPTSAKIICDSISPEGVRLTTAELTMHRFVLAEFNTHRVFSRNSASSRAIPVEKQLRKVTEDPAFPLEWPCEQRGMQGGAELEGISLIESQLLFNRIHDHVVEEVSAYIDAHPDKSTRLHKSLLNRLLEPFMWHTVIVTSVDYENFFHQRASQYSPLAQPEIKAVADLFLEEYDKSRPELVAFNQWHLPYIQEEEKLTVSLEIKKKLSVARCARVSYLTHDGVRDFDKDIELYDRLVSAKPPHASPLEHVATPTSEWDRTNGGVKGNFGPYWKQLRHMVGQ